ncbi:nitrite/sulfite reductase [Clostridium sp. MCC353]|uniref:nitrite/sulfite reductase n=1 Tax=Clostridium sp. MCC353 TaxID=2592646 RepID=UPI001C02564D|nr:nitrite/sulfite reductase [Clostridium sp. MCC353]MBT9776217.1 nitrite/sulfite reductase [Clostridium sp. MCC353]
MKTEYAQEFKAEIDAFKEMTERFYNKEITAKEYKGFSGRYGSYAQRGGEASMLRLRMTGGRITKEKLKFLVDCIEQYEITKVHLTTCQTIQLHNLDGVTAGDIMVKAADHDIITWGGGGDFPRNVMASPLSGAEPGEYFDVMPYAQAAADYLLSFINKVKMPRKLKVGFSNSTANETHATFRDLGFVATKEGRFDVYSAGGLGANPRPGLCVAKGIRPEKVLYYIKAMVETFIAYGNYENRAKARTRYMQITLGQKKYIAAYREKLDEILESGEDLDLKLVIHPMDKTGDGSVVSDRRIISQKQDGLYAVSYHPVGGTPKPEKWKEIYEVIKEMDQVELRLSPDADLYIINCTGDEAKKVLEVTSDGARDLFESSVACIGASICQVGIRDSQNLMAVLTEEMRKMDFGDGVLPKIHISGCPSSCGTHQIGTLGFHGGVKLIDKVPVPAFTLHVNGCPEEGKERFGDSWGVILEEDIPAFLKEVGEAVSGERTTFERWFTGHRDQLKAIAGKYLK